MKEESESEPAPRWTGAEILGTVLLVVLCMTVARPILDGSGFLRWYYGGEPPLEKEKLWLAAVSATLQILATLIWFRVVGGVPLADLGLTTKRLGRGVAAGLLFALIFTPGAYALQWLAVQAMQALGVAEQEHPFALLAKGDLSRGEWVALVVTVVVIAAAWEELFFRGILQPWAMSRPWGGSALLVAACLWTLAIRADFLNKAFADGAAAVGVELIPLAALLVAALACLLLSRRSRAAGGLFATAVLFAWVHVFVWPTPIPLLWLALGLGWLRWKSGSLVASLTLHAAFNAAAFLTLL